MPVPGLSSVFSDIKDIIKKSGIDIKTALRAGEHTRIQNLRNIQSCKEYEEFVEDLLGKNDFSFRKLFEAEEKFNSCFNDLEFLSRYIKGPRREDIESSIRDFVKFHEELRQKFREEIKKEIC